jgi:glutamate-ammonia-ligase adenylyltransferase
MRRFVKEWRFQVGAQVLLGKADPDRAGAAYTRLADVAIDAVLHATQAEFAKVHGHLPDSDFAVLAMGKLGGAEMNEASDLDLVLCYRLGDEHAKSDGERPLVGPHYYGRLSQRLINAITAPTTQGTLYEVDMRLRPSGNKGPVVTRIDAFIEYQRKEAWTWEHMALTRLRFIAGSDEMLATMQAALREILTRPRDPGKVFTDVAEMRAKMVAAKPSRDPWEMKLVRGGLVDQEFIAQALQLVHAHAQPQVLRRHTGQALAALADAGVLPSETAERLIAASRLMRGLLGILRVAWNGPFVPAEAPAGLVRALCQAAEVDDLAAVEAKLRATQAEVLDLFEVLVVRAAA